ncbi:MAG: hypothetical protein R6V06_10965 [Kiritimatiellia bacterium]
MRTRTHLFCVAWIYALLGLIHVVPGTVFAVTYWQQAQQYSGVGEGISLMFTAFGVLAIGISLIYFRVSLVYFYTAFGRLFFPGRVAVVLTMIIGFPYGSAAGAYALYVRNKHMMITEGTEPEN